MKKIILLLLLGFMIQQIIFAQPVDSIKKKGMPPYVDSEPGRGREIIKETFVPKMTTSERNKIKSPAEDLMIFNITTNCFEEFANGKWHSVNCHTNSSVDISNDSIRKKEFERLLEKGDSELLKDNSKDALTFYKQANKLIPDDIRVYWRMSILDCFKWKDFHRYWRLIAEADDRLDYKDYPLARLAYLCASRAKPEEKYAIERVNEMEKYIIEKPLNKKIINRKFDSLNVIYKKLLFAYRKKDSILITSVKDFISNEFGKDLHTVIYTKIDIDNSPYIFTFFSLADKIAEPPKSAKDSLLSLSNNFCYLKGEKYEKATKELNKKRCEVFCYKTYGMIAAQIKQRFLEYPAEAKSFILFHELTHEYSYKTKVLNQYINEALADVTGNYGTLEYARKTGKIDTLSAKKQIEINEKIYEYINYYVKQINEKHGKVDKLNKQCQKKLKPLISKGNFFQKDRFDYEVNNAYLLKNYNYSKYYFLIKKVYLKQGSIKKLLETMQDAPKDEEEVLKYLGRYS